jgi:hypothetical protein
VSKTLITRRDVLKIAAYVTPVILSMPFNPSFASAGSDNSYREDKAKNEEEKSKSNNGLHKGWFKDHDDNGLHKGRFKD